MNTWFLASGAWAILITFAHVFSGGPTVARPLLAANDIPETPKYTNYYCWHIVSFNIALMAALFLIAGWVETQSSMAIIATIQAAFAFCWGIALVPWKNQSYKEMPQGWLFLPNVILGIWGLAT